VTIGEGSLAARKPTVKFEPKRLFRALSGMDVAVLRVGTGRADLVARARGGDQDAFRALIEPELVRSLRSAAVVLGSDDDAADVVQDALVSAWQHLPSLREPEAFPGWLRRIVVRETIRKANSRREVTPLAETQPDDSATLDRTLEYRQLARAFRTLGVDDRTLLTLRHLLRLSVHEVALTLHIPDGTVKSRTQQAMQRLRAAYAAEDRR
jgi:RNA polymerase sigma-70 factor (ECF subfamily)